MLVECVPNFSCGAELAEELAAAARAHSGAGLLGIESDKDHQRTVVTVAGEPPAVLAAVKDLVALAVERLDLSKHSGVHPRTGVVDVAPFVPLGKTPMEVCVELAEQLGEWAGRELKLPCYLYDHAARRSENQNLAHLRRVISGPDRPLPDYGPVALHPRAGALLTGARFFLIAFNINLESEDIDVARRIAGKLREAKGGLPGVKALGFPLASKKLVQVSMNLCDYRKTGPVEAFDAVARMCAEEGVGIRESELVGLIPEDALPLGMARHLSLPEKSLSKKVLERKLSGVLPFSEFRGFLDKLSSTRPAPGGGSAAAVAGSLATATLLKALRLSRGGKTQLQILDGRAVNDVERELVELRERFLKLCEEDRKAFTAVMAAYRLRPTEADRETRRLRRRQAKSEAFQSSEAILAGTETLTRIALDLRQRGNPNLLNDVGIAVELAVSAAHGAVWNARSNLTSGAVPQHGEQLLQRLDALQKGRAEIQRALAEQA